MAEGFREYVMTRENANLGNKILNFFKDLYTKVTNWKRMQPHLTAYYQKINSGKYSNSTFKVDKLNNNKESNNTKFSTYSPEIKEQLSSKGWTEEKFDSISQDERDQAVKCLAF